MLAAMVSSNSTVSCVTMPIWARSEASVTSRMSRPSIVDGAARHVVEPRQQVDERRLAGAAAADDRDHLAGAHRERHAAQGAAAVAVVVAEADVLELDRAGERRQRRGARPLA